MDRVVISQSGKDKNSVHWLALQQRFSWPYFSSTGVCFNHRVETRVAQVRWTSFRFADLIGLYFAPMGRWSQKEQNLMRRIHKIRDAS